MPIASTDILIKYSVKTGTAGNQTAGTAAGSLGKYISTTQITTATLSNLFDAITGAENAVSESEYRCIFVHNNHATLAYQNVFVFISAEVAGGANATIGVDPTAATAVGAASVQAVEVANEDTAPAGVTFSAPTTYATGLAMGTLNAGQCRAVWIRRTATNSVPLANDGVTLRFQGESL